MYALAAVDSDSARAATDIGEPLSRLDGYLEYLERKRLEQAGREQPASDDELREYVRRLKERDRRASGA